MCYVLHRHVFCVYDYLSYTAKLNLKNKNRDFIEINLIIKNNNNIIIMILISTIDNKQGTLMIRDQVMFLED